MLCMYVISHLAVQVTLHKSWGGGGGGIMHNAQDLERYSQDP